MKAQDLSVTYAAFVVCAAARALARHPHLQRVLAGKRQLRPAHIDICLSVAGDAVVTPVVILEQADQKNVVSLSAEIRRKAPQARRETGRLLDGLNRWGWLLPSRLLRQQLLRFLLQWPQYRRKVSGTFQVSILPEPDLFVPLLFNTPAALGVGSIRERPLVIDGAVQAVLAAQFACAIDHGQWTGLDAQTFLRELRHILEREAASLCPEGVPSAPNT